MYFCQGTYCAASRTERDNTTPAGATAVLDEAANLENTVVDTVADPVVAVVDEAIMDMAMLESNDTSDEEIPPSVSDDTEVLSFYEFPCLAQNLPVASVIEKVNKWALTEAADVENADLVVADPVVAVVDEDMAPAVLDEAADVDRLSDMSCDDDSFIDSDCVPNSADSSDDSTDYSTDEDVMQVAKENVDHISRQEVPFASQEIPVIPQTDEGADNEIASRENTLTCSSRGCDRPSRPCPYCGKFKVRLTRHIRAVHKHEEQVKQMKKSGNDQRAGFQQLKRAGIMKYNMTVAGRKDAKLLRERPSKKDKSTVVCDNCSGVFSRHWFSSHKQNCHADGGSRPSPIAASVFFSQCELSDDFKKDILSRFISDEVGQLCQQDHTIIMFGSKLFRKLKSTQDKKVEVRKSVMTDMRRLGHVFTHFRDVFQKQNLGTATVPDMFKQEHLDILHDACDHYTSRKDTDGKDKAGLQVAIYYLLTKAAKTLRVFHLIRRDTVKANETAEFLDVLRESKDTFISLVVLSITPIRTAIHSFDESITFRILKIWVSCEIT